jgi:hypothetical protein
MSPSPGGGGSRLPYEKPSLRTISLIAEEVLGVGCKLPAGAPPGMPYPTNTSCLAPLGQCFTIETS